MHPILETIDLVKYYGDGESRIKAIDHTSITVDHGEFVAGVRFREIYPPPHAGRPGPAGQRAGHYQRTGFIFLKG